MTSATAAFAPSRRAAVRRARAPSASPALAPIAEASGRYTKGPAGARRPLWLPGEDVAGAALAAERLRAAARQPFETLADVDLTLAISLGVTEFRAEAADPTALLAEADRALYASKQGGPQPRERVPAERPGPRGRKRQNSILSVAARGAGARGLGGAH